MLVEHELSKRKWKKYMKLNMNWTIDVGDAPVGLIIATFCDTRNGSPAGRLGSQPCHH